MTIINLGFSPCPNDTFIFHGLVNGGIDTGDIRFIEHLLDIDQLNIAAELGSLDMIKVSFHAYLSLKDRYTLLTSGGALGRGCGPLLVVNNKDAYKNISDLKSKTIAIPGKLTTAYLLMRLYDPDISCNIIVMPFNNIMTAVVNGEVDAGLIIHESRFTYKSYGLHSIIDLGQWWEGETGLPIPLGCIILNKLNTEYVRINQLLRDSVLYGINNRDKTMDYVKNHSTEMSDDVINSHINLYVNDFTVNFGDVGMKAIDMLTSRASALNLRP
jgi:1,4-dihydroxy-6-naphthoate synthase